MIKKLLDNKKFRIGINFFLALLFILSAGVNVILIKKIVVYYKEINALRLDPLETRYIEDQSMSYELRSHERKLILFGDSRIAYWHPKPDLPGWTIINKGIRGQTTHQLLLRVKKDVLKHSPDLVVLQIGINDLKTIGLFPDRKEKIITDTEDNIKKIINEITHENINMAILTIFPTDKPGLIRSFLWSPETNAVIKNLNSKLKNINNEKIKIIDTDEALSAGQYIKKDFRKDMLHLNSNGYEKLNTLLFDCISKW